MTSNRKETAFEIAERINRAIDEMARIANSHDIPISPDHARLIYARCVQSTDRKWIGHQHYTMNMEKTIETLKMITPPHLFQVTQRTVRDAMDLIYKTDAEPGYSVTPSQIQDVHHPDPNVYRVRLEQLIEANLNLSQQKRTHHRRLLQRIDGQTREQAVELHRAVASLPLREAIPGSATPQVIEEIIHILADQDIPINIRQAHTLHDLANNRPAQELVR